MVVLGTKLGARRGRRCSPHSPHPHLPPVTFSNFRIKSADEMDKDRVQSIAYEYLCHLQVTSLTASTCEIQFI